MSKIKLNDLSISDLIGLEKISNIVCKNYENVIKIYDGSISTNTTEYKIFTFYNNIRLSILKEMEERLKNID